MKSKKTAALELAKLCCRALDGKKAGGLTVLDVSEQSSITDFLVLATATSAPHLRALRIELEKTLDAARVHLVGMESAQESGWMVVDAFDVMVHLFLAEARERYALERLWRDAKEISVAKILASPATVAARQKPAARKGVKRRAKTAGEK
jgi:ribosome-associated protein